MQLQQLLQGRGPLATTTTAAGCAVHQVCLTACSQVFWATRCRRGQPQGCCRANFPCYQSGCRGWRGPALPYCLRGEGLPFPTVCLVPSTYCVQITGGPAASAAAGWAARCGPCTERPEALGHQGSESSQERSKTQADGGDGPVSGVGGAAGAQQAGVVCGSCIHSGAAVGHWRGAQHSTPAASMATTW